jgi:hypothetical protein
VPTATPTPVPSATPAPTASPTPSPTDDALPADAPPRILGVSISKTVFGIGDVISGTMTTTSNVASVEARIGTFGISVPKTGVGRFELNYQVPSIAYLFRGPLTLELIARNSRGDRAVRDVHITIR